MVTTTKTIENALRTEEHVPEEVYRYSAPVPQLAVGRPGKTGVLRLRYEKRSGITRLVDVYQQVPLRSSRSLYVDPRRPDMVMNYVVSLGGGILQGDRLSMDVLAGEETAVHLTTQSATKAYRMEHDYGVHHMRFSVAAGAYVEWIPDPLIPYRNSRLWQTASVQVHPEATVVFSDTLLPGREGEPFTYDVLYNRVRFYRPDGRPIVDDAVCLEPAVHSVHDVGLMGEYGVMGTLYIVTPLISPERLVDALLSDTVAQSGTMGNGSVTAQTRDRVLFGCTVLPDEAGVMVRCLSVSPLAARQTIRSLWNIARQRLIGCSVPGRIGTEKLAQSTQHNS